MLSRWCYPKSAYGGDHTYHVSSQYAKALQRYRLMSTVACSASYSLLLYTRTVRSTKKHLITYGLHCLKTICAKFGEVLINGLGLVWKIQNGPFQPDTACVCQRHKTGKWPPNLHPNPPPVTARTDPPADKHTHHITHPLNTHTHTTLNMSVCVTRSHRANCLWFQQEFPVDTNIFRSHRNRILDTLREPQQDSWMSGTSQMKFMSLS